MRLAVLASVLAGLLLLAALPASASAGMEGWQYQREIAIQENSGETLSDYQVLVALAGSDFPGEAQADGGDIRFTDADGRELSYWIEEFDARSKRARIWVAVPDIPANGEVMITMWYGNPGAKRESDGEAVFEFFDTGNEIDEWILSGNAGQSTTVGNPAPSYYSYPKAYMYRNIGLVANSIIEVDMETDSSISQVVVLDFPFLVNANGYGQHFRLESRTGYISGFSWKTDWFPYNWGAPVSGNTYSANKWYKIKIAMDDTHAWGWVDGVLIPTSPYQLRLTDHNTYIGISWNGRVDNIRVRRHASPEPTTTIAPPAPATHTDLTITKSPSPHSIRQFQETTITLSIENTGTTDATDIEITDAIHPSFDLTSGDFPNPKRYDLIRPGETRDLQYTIRAMEGGTFTLDPATVTYADEDGNIQEASSEPASIKVIPSTEGGTSGSTPRSNPSVTTASVQLHGEKTNVVLGEDILLKLSAVNLITKPTMHVQVIIIPPSGMSVTSSAFAKSGAGQYTTTYELEPGSGKDIEVAIRSNQVGDFDVNGRIIYYFGDDREDAEDHTLTLPITVRAEPEPDQTAGTSESEGSSTPGFGAVVAGMILFAIYLRRKRA
jgi:hypothetical protein